MNAPSHDNQLLGAYVLGVLDTDETERVQRHLDSCMDCRAECDRLLAARAVLRQVPAGALAEGPPPDDRVLHRALRVIRAEKRATRPRRRVLALAASLLVLVGTFGAGMAIGQSLGPQTAAQPSLSPTVQTSAEGRHARAVDPATGVALAVNVVPATGWVRVNAQVTGVPAGETCQLVVIRRDGTTEIAGGWLASKKGETEAVTLDGSAAVPLDDVIAVAVRNTAGTTFATVSL